MAKFQSNWNYGHAHIVFPATQLKVLQAAIDFLGMCGWPTVGVTSDSFSVRDYYPPLNDGFISLKFLNYHCYFTNRIPIICCEYPK